MPLWARLKAAEPFFLMAGPNVIESREHCLRMADMIQVLPPRPRIAATASTHMRTCAVV
jgi:3-deoxy-D-manno-octulosonic acid (KDO) 8-phosphate synthase